MAKKGKKKRQQVLPVGMRPQCSSNASNEKTGSGGTSEKLLTPCGRPLAESSTDKQQNAPQEMSSFGVGQEAVPDHTRPHAASGARPRTVPPKMTLQASTSASQLKTTPPETTLKATTSGTISKPVPDENTLQAATSGAMYQVVPFAMSPSSSGEFDENVALEDPQDNGRVKRKWREMSPEDIGIEYKKSIMPLPRKPGFNKEGKPINLVSNCFPLTIPGGNVYQYDVEIYNESRMSTTTVQKKITPENKKFKCLNTKCNRKVFNKMVQHSDFKNILPVYDGRKNMYTKTRLKFSKDQFKRKVALPPDNPNVTMDDTFWVYIKPVTKEDTDDNAISLDPLQALFAGKVTSVPREVFMAVETVLKHSPCLRHLPFGQSFFFPPKYPHPLGTGKEIWFGYHQSMRLGQNTPMVNLDVSASTFFKKGPLLDYLADHFECNTEGLHRVAMRGEEVVRIMKPLNDMLKNIQIEVTHLRGYRRKYRMVRFTTLSADRLEFDMEREGGGMVKKTVSQYFSERHQIMLQFSNLPCIQVKPENKNRFFPVEVCEVIEGQRYTGTLLSSETAQMVKDTAYRPKDRFKEIRRIFQDETKFSHDPYLKEFGISVSSEPMKVEARLLYTPTIEYHSSSGDPIVKPGINGSWNMMNKKFVIGSKVKSWALVSFCGLNKSSLKTFVDTMVDLARNHGMELDACRFISMEREPQNVENYDIYVENILRELKRNYQIQLVVFVNSRDLSEVQSKALYRSVKDVASKLDIVSQCVKPVNVGKCNKGVIANILLKINAKMGGTNSTLTAGEMPSFMMKRIMFVGADVTHPSPTGDIACSVAAMVGSTDKRFSIYAVATRTQVNESYSKRSREVIEDVKGMMKELLMAFQKRNCGRLPLRIVVYRDGVSDGEIVEVRDKEVEQIRCASRDVDKDYEPDLTYVVVQKRHNVRTMQQDSRGFDLAKGNPYPGSLIDSMITHPLNYDFFLYSHWGLQGTSRPAYYTVVNDDNGTKVNEMHRMTLYLAYIYARCTKGISCPAPARYADLAAFAARQRLLKHKLSQPQAPYNPNAAKLTKSELKDLNNLIKLKFEDIV